MSFKKHLFYKGLNHEMAFGKHQGKTLKTICELDPEYIYWLRDNPNVLKIKPEVTTYANGIKHPQKPNF